MGPATGISGGGKMLNSQFVDYFDDVFGAVGDGASGPAFSPGETRPCHRDQTELEIGSASYEG
ncbi:hypothetical protein GCM10009526_15050 [Glutamicibacter creatinolyticus]